MKLHGLLLAALMTGMALAGCASDPPQPTPADELKLKPTATTGIIRGIVVDSAITPVGGADITVRAGEREVATKSNDAGAFGFEGLEPGTYFVRVTKPGFTTVQQSAEVVADLADPPIMRVQLQVDASFVKPYSQAYLFKGFIECSASADAVSGAICSIPNEAGCGIDPTGATCTNFTNDNFAVRYDLPVPLPTMAQSELVWTSTQAAGSSMALLYSRDCGEDNGGFLCDIESSGTSPQVISLKGGELANATYQEGLDLNQIYIRVFNRGVEGTSVVDYGFGVTFEQSFEVYTHIFYGYEPPAGWQFSRDGDAKPPAM